MPVEDAVRWNERYENPDRKGWATEPRQFLLDHLDLLPQSGLALDLAMGVGFNAGVLIDRGLHVVGVDIAPVAVALAKMMDPRLSAVVADLADFSFPDRTFDVILNLYFLQRDWVRDFSRIIKPGGWVVMETLTCNMRSIKPDLPDAYLLDRGEILSLFAGWDVRVYREGWFPARNGKRKSVAGIVAQFPAVYGGEG